MPIQQIAYDIPNDIAVELLRGVYKRFGGVVRVSETGAIVKHLKEVEIPEDNVLIKSVKKHPVATIGIGVSIAVAGAATAYIIKKKKEKEERKNAPECVIKFEKSLKKYLRAVRKGTLDEKTLDKLMGDLNEIDSWDGNEQIPIDLSTSELKELVNIIYGYTKKLAKANAVKLDSFKEKSPNYISNLKSYLEIQKKIFKEAA